MARLKFCGFDYTHTAGNSMTNGSMGATNIVDPALDSGMLVQDFSNDAVSYAPGASLTSAVTYSRQGTHADSGTLGLRSSGSGSSLGGLFATYLQGVTCLRSTLGDPSELWVTLDIAHEFNQNVDDVANLQRSESRFQVFKWGDLSLRLRRVFNYVSSVADITFELFNVAASLGTITITGLASNQFMHVRIHAKLDAVSGAFEVSIDGNDSNHTGINTVATTTLVNATQLWFSSGALGRVAVSALYSIGTMDNLLIDDAAFPVGRPSGRRVALSSDGTLSGFAATSGGTLTAALASIDANKARGTGVGATALLNFAAITTTGLNNELLGWQLKACGVSNVDIASAKRVIGGIDLSGTPYNGTNWATMTPPLTPSVQHPTMETVFYKGGTTDFVLADITNCKIRLEVADV